MFRSHPFATAAAAAAAAGDVLRKQALRVAEQALKATRSTEVCVAQCNCLGTAFAHVGDCLMEWHGLFGSGTTLTMEELVGEMKRGLQLLQSCKERSWVIRTLLLGESREEFKEVHSKLRECIRLVSLSLIKVVDVNEEWKITETHRQFCSKMSSLDRMLGDAAVMDRTDLLKMVQESLKGFRNRLQFFRGSATGLKMLHKILLSQYTEDHDGLPEHLLINHKQLKLKKHIAQGAFGTVYEATWLGYPFAVKVSNEESICFDRELAALVALKHPNIVHIVGYSHEAEKQEYSIVMEKMSMDLAGLIRKKKKARDGPPFSMRVTISIMLQIAKAMSFLHSEHVIHRDLKTANILVEFLENHHALGKEVDFTVKIADFGLARTNFITSQDGSKTPRCGTRGFMAPEVYDSKDYTEKADVYSYAMVCYQILTGETPFEDIRGRDDFIVMIRDEGKRPELPSSCPPDLATLLRNCWSGSSNERPCFSDICDILNLFKAQMLTSNSLYELKELENELKYPVSIVEGCQSNELFFFDMVTTYHLEDLRRAFWEALGTGSSSITYKTKLQNGNLLAVKRLNDWETPHYTLEQWIQIIGSMRHMNVAPLQAYYFGKDETLLVYEYMPKGSLSTILHNGGETTLDWPSRVRIAIGAGRGVAYLHQRGIAHGKIHASNILLGENFEPLVSDAGLVCVLNSTSQEGHVNDLEASQTLDVYNFGVLLLELLTRKAGTDLVGWVRSMVHKGKAMEVFDQELMRYQNIELELKQMLHVAMICTSLSPPPTMRPVVGILEDYILMRKNVICPWEHIQEVLLLSL